jgi:hypothetical protein
LALMKDLEVAMLSGLESERHAALLVSKLHCSMHLSFQIFTMKQGGGSIPYNFQNVISGLRYYLGLLMWLFAFIHRLRNWLYISARYNFFGNHFDKKHAQYIKIFTTI